MAVKTGDKVKVHYTAKLDDDVVFDSSHGGDPAEFTVGQGEVIEGLDEAVVGMKEGETKSVEVPPEKGFGKRVEGRIVEVARIDLPEGLDPVEGQVLRSMDPDGKTNLVKVTGVAEETVTIDTNHPLAGRELKLDLELVGVE